jgi:acyl-CoA thioesterase
MRDEEARSAAPPEPGMGPLAEVLGIRRLSSTGGRASFGLTVCREHMNPYGVVHGGVIASLIDYAMGGALTSSLHAGERCATMEIQTHYLAAVAAGGLRADARVVERTRRTAVLEARVHADGERLVAHATGSFFIERG